MILLIGDLHIKATNGAMVDLFEEQVMAYLDTARIETVVLLGDILHTHERVHTLAMNRAVHLFKQLSARAKLFVLVGNHDYIHNDQFLSDHHWMGPLKEWENIVIVDRAVQHEGILLVPYVPNGRFIEALETSGQDWQKTRLICAHQEFAGCSMRNGIISIHGDEWKSSYPRVISGHIHGSQELACGVFYPGSAIPDEEGARNRQMCTFDDVTGAIEYIPLVYPRGPVTEQVSLSSLRENIAEILQRATRVVITDDYEAFRQFRKSADYTALAEGGIKVTFKPRAPDYDAMRPSAIESETTFQERLYNCVLSARDEVLFCALQSLYDHEMEEDDVLIIPVTQSTGAREQTDNSSCLVETSLPTA